MFKTKIGQLKLPSHFYLVFGRISSTFNVYDLLLQLIVQIMSLFIPLVKFSCSFLQWTKEDIDFQTELQKHCQD